MQAYLGPRIAQHGFRQATLLILRLIRRMMEEWRNGQSCDQRRGILAEWDEPGCVSAKCSDGRHACSKHSVPLRDHSRLHDRSVFLGCMLVVACMMWGCLYALRTHTELWSHGWHILLESLDTIHPAYILTHHGVIAPSLLLQVFQVYPPVRIALNLSLIHI